jgi:Ala-tRNA(Pro) deacylase
MAVELHEHPPVFTVEESRVHTSRIPGGHCKNLFLKDKKDRLWLVTVADDRRVDLVALGRHLGATGRLSFGKPPLLAEVLGVTPGSVTPLAVINDRVRRVAVVLDRALAEQDRVNCHPLVNTATVVLATRDLQRFFQATGHEPLIVDFDALPGRP